MDAETWDRIRRGAKRRTDASFAREAARITHLTDAEIMEITPEPVDREKLAELMAVVKDAAKTNRQKADAIRNIQGLAEIAVAVLGKFV